MAARNPPASADRRALILFAVAAAAAVALGSAGLALSGVAFGSWVRTPVALAVGLILGLGMIAVGRRRSVDVLLVVATIIALTATFSFPDQSGVHRWIDLGAVHVNVAGLLLPLAIVALGEVVLARPVFLAAIAAIAALLVAQPDASQATAFAVGGSLLLLGRRDLSAAVSLIAILGLAGLALVAWLRPDPLLPVPEVEGVFGLLAAVSLPLAAAAAVALATTSLSPLLRTSDPESRMPAGAPLAGYFATTAIMPLLGAYPVPLVGLGMSFPVGYCLGMALLCAKPGTATR